jgi:hypothetical protein
MPQRDIRLLMPLSRKRRMPLLREADATGRTLAIYQEMKAALGLPHVNLLFQAFGAHPALLEFQWQTIRPMVETREFFNAAECLRAEAYTQVHNYFTVPDTRERLSTERFPRESFAEVAKVVDLFHYNNPLLLVIVGAQFMALEETPASPRTGAGPAPHPVFPEAPAKVTEESAPTHIRRIFDDMKRTLGTNLVNTDYQAFAVWPDFLATYWQELKPCASSPLYNENKHAIRESAMWAAGQLPKAPQFTVDQMQEAGLSDDDTGAAIYLTEEFLDLLTGLVLNIAFAKIGLEGGNRARSSKPAQTPAAIVDSGERAA